MVLAVAGVVAQPVAVEVGSHRAVGQRVERQRCDKALRPRRHHHIHQRPRLRQLTRQIGHLIGRDAPTHAEDDRFAC